jgi:hypothetical protein
MFDVRRVGKTLEISETLEKKIGGRGWGILIIKEGHRMNRKAIFAISCAILAVFLIETLAVLAWA